MNRLPADYAERVYAGVVGKVIGVYLGRPFEPIPSLILQAEYVTKALAVCHRCGGPGLFTQRVVVSDELVVLGAEGAYEARCRRCYDPEEALQESLDLETEAEAV